MIYDGDCPLCRLCVQRLRVRGSETRFVLIDARQDREQRRWLVCRGFDLNDGIVIDRGDGYCSGADAVHAPALLQDGAGGRTFLCRTLICRKTEVSASS